MAKINKKTIKKIVETGNPAKMAITAKAFEKVVAKEPEGRFILILYVSGMTLRSRQAIDNIQALCKEHMAGRYDLKIIDIYQQPDLAKNAQIIAVPTLIKSLPLPLRRVIGDLGDPGRVLLALGLAKPKSKSKANGL